MTKPIITKEQADFFSRFMNHELTKGLSQGEIWKCLVGDYEIEPQFKVGDWIVNIYNEDVGIVTELGSSYLKYDDGLSDGFHNFRHATPEEIAEEKQRRWWAKHDREVWKLYLYEAVIDGDGFPYFIIDAYKDYEKGEVTYIISGGREFNKDDMGYYFKVLYFADDRLDHAR